MDRMPEWHGTQGIALSDHLHVCVFYQDEDEKYRTLRTFFEDGFCRNDKNLHVVDHRKHASHRRRLREFGIDVAAAEESGRLEIRGWEQAHLSPGWFDQHAMIGQVEEILRSAAEEGFSFARLVGDMGWARKDVRGVRDLVEYCVRLQGILPQFATSVICTYDLRQFSALQVVEVLRSHPVAVIRGMVHENPYYLPAEVMLEDIARRRQHDEPTSVEDSSHDAS